MIKYILVQFWVMDVGEFALRGVFMLHRHGILSIRYVGITNLGTAEISPVGCQVKV